MPWNYFYNGLSDWTGHPLERNYILGWGAHMPMVTSLVFPSLLSLPLIPGHRWNMYVRTHTRSYVFPEVWLAPGGRPSSTLVRNGVGEVG